MSTWDHSSVEYEVYRTPERTMLEARAKHLELLLDAYWLSEGNPFLPDDNPYVASSALVRSARLESFRNRVDNALRFANRAVDAKPENPQAVAVRQEYRRARRSHFRSFSP